MWLVGVVIRRYIDILIIIINFPYSTCIRSFFGSSILTSLFIFKMFFRSLYPLANSNQHLSAHMVVTISVKSIGCLHNNVTLLVLCEEPTSTQLCAYFHKYWPLGVGM